MKKIQGFLLLITLVPCLLNAQGNLQNQIIRDILDARVLKLAEVAVSPTVVPEFVEKHLPKLTRSKSLVFHSETGKDSIQLTEPERVLILESLRAEYIQRWKESEVAPYKLLGERSVREFLNAPNGNNSLAHISHPIMIRDGKYAVLYFANFNMTVPKPVSDISVYRKQNGKWQKWISLSDEPKN